ncbi:keratinocyte-associated protein 2 [Lingula anatina]|uniref:Keratinocyte-associated protein 2 n=1 Tax=Lingula anatina TaxID=7574 RepID=A0A1S3H2X6_LINAN|nr:keratinocyte-associated protein 2 [Lingula anatina]|eukprot:XP_013379489.1 keratinocyte-associated protein 2 [Lingula anatina]
MAVSSGLSFLMSTAVTILIFGGMQLYKSQLASKEWMTILGGFIGSCLFIFLLTAVSNLESTLFGSGFQTKLFPEVLFCLAVAMFASGLVHRVCITTCFIFSLVALYYINRISQGLYAPPVPVGTAATPGKKKRN